MTNKIKKSYNGFNIASLVCGICGFLFLGILLEPLAIIFAGVATSKKQRNGIGTAGMVLGIVGSAFVLLALCFGASLLSAYSKLR